MVGLGKRTFARSRFLLRQGLRSVRAANGRQLALTALLIAIGIGFARFSWYLPITADAENSLYDLRTYIAAPRVEQDDRIQIVKYDDQTLIAARKRSPLDRGLLAKALKNLDGMGAKTIGIDILFDQPQDEDDELVETLRAMKTPVFVAYAEIDSNQADITFEQQQYLDSFIERLDGSGAKPASIRLDYASGVARRWPEQLPGLPASLGLAMVKAGNEPGISRFDGYDGSIRYRQSRYAGIPVFSSLRIDLFADPTVSQIPDLSQALAAQIADRYVLIGGEIVGVDQVETPYTATTGQTMPGIRVHAALIAQMLDRDIQPGIAGWQLWAIAVLVALAAALTSLIEARVWRILPFLAAQILLIGGMPFALQFAGYDTYGTPSVGWIIGWTLAFTAVSSAVRASGAVERQFAQSALGKYLPQDIAKEIIEDPKKLSLTGSKKNLYILFSDLEGFTKLSHQLEPEVVAKLLNEYLDKLSAVVLEHGGIIDKYVGDAVVAFWGAPIARPDDARNAALAGYALWQAGEEFRNSVDPSLPPIGKTRVGLHYGEAIVGNFGGERRIQYTALGDAMNTAARLEAANKSLASSVMASREFADSSEIDWWRPMGKVVLRGRARPVEIFEPAPGFPDEDRADLREALGLVGIDTDKALLIIQKVVERHPSDSALKNLLERTRNLGKEDAYVLG